MAVDIHSYDQVPDQDSVALVPEPATTAANTALVETETISTEDEFKVESSNLKLAGEQWSSDPSSYLNNNVMDLERNVLILHSRKPQELSFASSPSSPSLYYPYRRSSDSSRSISQPSTPPLTDSGSSSSASSSPSSSPGSPSFFHMSSGDSSALSEKDDLCSLDSLSSPLSLLEGIKSQPARILSVRGLGAGGRRMQVYLV
ncbi:hypothetical protein BGZ46_004595 [Entomortierella lignicola]|nr:hypothetical protein BGZ46_004595 [Entomortierella lignicola]